MGDNESILKEILKKLEKKLSSESEDFISYAKRKFKLMEKFREFAEKNDFSPEELVGCAIFIFAQAIQENDENYSTFVREVKQFVVHAKIVWEEEEEEE